MKPEPMPLPAIPELTPLSLALIAAAGFVAGAINAVAGGGSLVSFPVLVGVGLPELNANATNSVALWPGSAAGAFGYRERYAAVKKHMKTLAAPTVVGSLLGAYLLVLTPARAFALIVPFLVLGATLLLAFQPQVKAWAAAKREAAAGNGRTSGLGAGIAQFGVALYGGYFGAGMGIMMLAVLTVLADGDLHDLNALKNWLGVIINFGASVILLSQGLVLLIPGLAMMAGALLGGYFSAKWAQTLPAETVRKGVVVYGVAAGLWFLIRALS